MESFFLEFNNIPRKFSKSSLVIICLTDLFGRQNWVTFEFKGKNPLKNIYKWKIN